MSEHDYTAATRQPPITDLPGLQAGSLRLTARMLADILSTVEIGIIALASLTAKALYLAVTAARDPGIEPYLISGVAGGVLAFYILRVRHLSTPKAIANGARSWLAITGSIGLAFLLLIALAYVLKISDTYSRGWLLSWMLLSSLFILAWRIASRRIIGNLSASGHITRRIALVSVTPPDRRLIEAIERGKQATVSGVYVLGHLHPATRDGSFLASPRDVERDLAHDLRRDHGDALDEVIINSAGLDGTRLKSVIGQLSVLPADIWISTGAIDYDLPYYGFDNLGDVSVLQVRHNPIYGWGFVAKQIIDYVVAAAAITFLLPLFAAIAVAIKLDSPGPVFFRQRRHGYNEREIVVIKFRTMTAQEDGDSVEQARRNDPRVTRVGRFLRSSSLDELPQLINVLKGEMSLVGPRPHAIAHNEYYRSRVINYANRHRVKPGITGLAQVKGLRGETQDPDMMRRRVEMDLQYIDNWSLSLDVKILALTPVFGLISRNAF